MKPSTFRLTSTAASVIVVIVAFVLYKRNPRLIMTPKFDREEILCEISIHTVETRLVSLAFEFAVLGYLDVARRLVSLLNNHNPLYDKNSVLMKPLWLAWAETDNWPDREFEKVKEPIEELAKSYYEDLGYQNGQKSQYSDDEDGLRHILESIGAMNSESEDTTTGCAAMDKSSALVKALDLLLKFAENEQEGGDAPSRKKEKAETGQERQKEKADLPSIKDILDRIAERLHCSNQINYLAQSARAWKILKNGALAKAVGVQDAKVVKLAKEVEDTFKQRFTSGRQAFDDQTMAELIKTCSENTRTNEGAKVFWAESGWDIPETFVRDPASPEEIAELEKRLDVKLPADYKEFLGVSNGLGMTWSGIIMDPPLHSIEDIRWLADDEDYFLDLDLDLLGQEIYFIAAHDFPDIQDTWPKVGRAMEIGTEDIENVWLLPPETVDKVRKAYLEIVDSEAASEDTKKIMLNSIYSFAGSREKFERLDWCVLTWAAGGAAAMKGYPSFKVFMSEKARESGAAVYSYKMESFAYSCR